MPVSGDDIEKQRYDNNSDSDLCWAMTASRRRQMVDISFEINGEAVLPDSMTDVLDILFLKHVREKIEANCSSINCLEHGGTPSIIVKGENIDSLEYEVYGCCDDFVNKVKKILSRRR
jgi:hypothetical protein